MKSWQSCRRRIDLKLAEIAPYKWFAHCSFYLSISVFPIRFDWAKKRSIAVITSRVLQTFVYNCTATIDMVHWAIKIILCKICIYFICSIIQGSWQKTLEPILSKYHIGIHIKYFKLFFLGLNFLLIWIQKKPCIFMTMNNFSWPCNQYCWLRCTAIRPSIIHSWFIAIIRFKSNKLT